MERNTVIIDLDRYEKMLQQLEFRQNKIWEFEELLKDNILVSKKSFYIDDDISEEPSLYMNLEVAEQMVNSIGGYNIENTTRTKELKISNYYFKLKKED